MTTDDLRAIFERDQRNAHRREILESAAARRRLQGQLPPGLDCTVDQLTEQLVASLHQFALGLQATFEQIAAVTSALAEPDAFAAVQALGQDVRQLRTDLRHARFQHGSRDDR